MNDKIYDAFAEIHADDVLIDKTLDYLHRKTKKRRRGRKGVPLSMGLSAVAAIVLLAVGIFSYNLYFTPAAHISIDVNPSLELTINKFDAVIATYAFNEDGGRILSEVSLQGKGYDEAAGLILSAMEADGYLAGDALVSVAVQAANRDKESILCDALRQLIGERVLSARAAAEVEIFPVTAEIWQGAHGCHMSPAKYLAIQALMEVDGQATIEAYSDSSIRQIRRRAQECRGMHSMESENSNSEPAPSDEHGHGKGNGNGHGHGSGH